MLIIKYRNCQTQMLHYKMQILYKADEKWKKTI